jgi:glycosyltransferase involved in cell wall biosynthesis
VRVLQVTSYYAPAWAYGGPPRVMAEYARGLVARGHDVTVFTTDVLDAEQRARPLRERLDGVRVERFPNLSNTLAWRTKKYLPPGLVAATARRMRTFDVVHVTDTRTLATATAYLAARVAGVPFVLSAHGSLPASAGVRGAVKGAYDRVLVRPMLERAALLLAQTDHESRLYAKAGAWTDRVRLLPLPFDLSSVPPALEPGFLRRGTRAADGSPLVLFLGRIHYLKGLDVLVDALAPDLAAGRATLAVVGRDDGHWGAIAERHGALLASGALAFLGPIYGADRFSAYADADVFCLTPRHWEETSVAALEAAAVGTPLVLTEQADIPGLVDAGGGFVVPCEPERVRSAVLSALERPRELGVRARALVERQHATDAVVGRLESYLAAVARSA